MKIYTVHYSPTLDLAEGDLLEDFTFPWQDRPCPQTSFRAVWNDRHLGFRFEVDDDDLVLGESDDVDEATLGSDRVELFFASSLDLSTPYYGAEMEPRGGVYDYKARFHRKFDDSWTFPGLEFAGEILEGGYAVEGSLPLDVLRGLGCLKDSEMIAGVYRAEFSHGAEGIVQDWISWVDPMVEMPDFHVPSSFGKFLLTGR